MKIRIEIKTNEAGGYTATCPSLPGCICQGQSRDEVKEKINEAICGYIAAIHDFVPEKRELVEA